jgi:hypothetical protein
LPGHTTGAQRASRRFSFGSRSRSFGASIIAASLLASLIAAPAAAGSTVASVRIPAVTPVVTTSIERSWLPEEIFVLNLTNCTRTGGWVQSDGSCRGYGSGRYSTYVAPLRNSAGMADTVARPYAKLLAVRKACSHFLDGNPGDRLRRAGYTGYTWGENIGCRDGYSYAKTAVLASHLNFQAEKSSNGGHWKNIKNPKFKWIGIGVWKYSNRVRLVTDFYSG